MPNTSFFILFYFFLLVVMKAKKKKKKEGQTVMGPVGCRASRCSESWSSPSIGHKEISAEGRRVTGVAGDFWVPEHKDGREEESPRTSGESRRGGRKSGGVDESACLLFCCANVTSRLLLPERPLIGGLVWIVRCIWGWWLLELDFELSLKEEWEGNHGWVKQREAEENVSKDFWQKYHSISVGTSKLMGTKEL